MRTTQANIDVRIRTINTLLGMPTEPYTKDAEGKLRANVGHYMAESTYSGWTLTRMSNESGGVRTVSDCVQGKNAFGDVLFAFIQGIQAMRDAKGM